MSVSLAPALSSPGRESRKGQRYLRFSVGLEEDILLPVEQILDVFPVLVSQILPVPEMGNGVMGLYNRRGSILWLVDLGSLLGADPLTAQPAQSWMGITVALEQKVVGLVVRQVQDIEWQDDQQVQPITAGLFAPEIAAVIRGYRIEAAAIVLVLDPQALLQQL